MFRFQLSDGTELTITLDLSAKSIVIMQTRQLASTGGIAQQRIAVPLADVKQIVKTVKDLRAYFI